MGEFALGASRLPSPGPVRRLTRRQEPDPAARGALWRTAGECAGGLRLGFSPDSATNRFTSYYLGLSSYFLEYQVETVVQINVNITLS